MFLAPVIDDVLESKYDPLTLNRVFPNFIFDEIKAESVNEIEVLLA